MESSAQRYIAVFIITLTIFGLAFFASTVLGNKKIEQITNAQQDISLEILSTETRYALLGSSSCEYKIQNENFEFSLNQELNDLARRVKFLESELGGNNRTVQQLKKQYNLLQIKDYLLWRDIQAECGEQMVSILYFHEPNCRRCQNQTVILDELVKMYPEVRIYWFDRDLATPAVETLVAMFGIKKSPSIVIEGQVITDFYARRRF
ncbi:MAG: thioredoxin family protein [Candidatus Pacebacteria bacterium]|nr:thioredoxin family protein [Candidatus Paceibacterota bacterium]